MTSEDDAIEMEPKEDNSMEDKMILRVVLYEAFLEPQFEIYKFDELDISKLKSLYKEARSGGGEKEADVAKMREAVRSSQGNFPALSYVQLKVTAGDATAHVKVVDIDPEDENDSTRLLEMDELPQQFFGLIYFNTLCRVDIPITMDGTKLKLPKELNFEFVSQPDAGIIARATCQTSKLLRKYETPLEGEVFHKEIEKNWIEFIKDDGVKRPEKEDERGWIEGELQIMSRSTALQRPPERNCDPVISGQIQDKKVKKEAFGMMYSLFGAFPSCASQIESFAFSHCQSDDFDDTLELCLSKSDDPLHTVMKASRFCINRSKSQKSTDEDWDERKEQAIKIAQTMVNYLDQPPDKPFRHPKQKQLREYLINKNIDYAIENQIEDMCEHPIFLDRVGQRWQKTGKNIRKNPCRQMWWRASPWFSCWLQLIFYVLFLCLLVHVTNPQFLIYHMTWSDSVSQSVFGSATDANGFAAIGDANSFYQWLNEKLIPTAYSEDTPYQILANPIFQVRQFRVLPDPHLCSETNTSCYPSIESGHQQKGGKWQNTVWITGDSDFTLRGVANAFYPGGGYTANLGPTSADALNTVSDLNSTGWIDEGTRAVIVEIAMYSPTSDAYLLLQGLVEFTFVGTVSATSGVSLVSAKQLDQVLDWTAVLLFVCVLAYLFQEISEYTLETLMQYEHLLAELATQQENSSNFETGKSQQPQQQLFASIESGKQVKSPFRKAFGRASMNHWSDMWNILDFSNTVFLLVFLFFMYFAYSQIPDRPVGVDFNLLLLIQWRSGIGFFFAAVALIFSWFRILYFSMPFPIIGTLVLAVVKITGNVVEFFILLLVFVIGFGTAFGALFGGTLLAFTDNIWDLLVNALLLALSQFGGETGDTPFQASWPRATGRVLLVVYTFLCGTLLINMLIAMMGNTFNDLMAEESINKKWALKSGELLLHYERFNWLPPPLNVIEVLIRGIIKLIEKLKSPATKKAITGRDEEESDDTNDYYSFDDDDALDYTFVLHMKNPPNPTSPVWKSDWAEVQKDITTAWRDSKEEEERKKVEEASKFQDLVNEALVKLKKSKSKSKKAKQPLTSDESGDDDDSNPDGDDDDNKPKPTVRSLSIPVTTPTPSQPVKTARLEGFSIDESDDNSTTSKAEKADKSTTSKAEKGSQTARLGYSLESDDDTDDDAEKKQEKTEKPQEPPKLVSKPSARLDYQISDSDTSGSDQEKVDDKDDTASTSEKTSIKSSKPTTSSALLQQADDDDDDDDDGGDGGPYHKM